MRQAFSGLLEPLSPRTRNAVLFLMGVAVTAVVLLLVYAILTAATKSSQIRSTQETNTAKTDANVKTLTIIRDCTTPGRPCYDRGQQQQAAILTSAQRTILLSAVCAVDLDPSDSIEVRVQQITACVTGRLRKP